nr:indolepyruvate ferredoxin oxidoreductase family protein [Pseudooceanicola sp. HF7]
MNDRFDLTRGSVLLNGTQALVRLMLAQKARDTRAGLNTAGYVTGYRGSPLGAVDMQMRRAGPLLKEADVLFKEGLNEDLAATALWGSQQAGLRGEGRFDGVFGLWYGKGPGVDRSGDAFRHANMAGTDPNGGVLVAMGDDHTGESSTVLHASEWAAMDAMMPVLSPAGVQEILDLGHYGYGLSRFAGVWTALKLMKDTVEATAVVDGNPDRVKLVTPQMDLPEGGLNIRLVDSPVEQEARMLDFKRHAAEAYARANRIDQRGWGAPGARIGFVAAGKNWLDLQHALSLLGLAEGDAERLGITTYKIAQVWPLDRQSFSEWAAGLDLIVVVEEKRKILESQIKETLYGRADAPRVHGAEKDGKVLFPAKMQLDPVMIAEGLGQILTEEGCSSAALEAGLAALEDVRRNDTVTDIAARLPYFCSGCPHNSSTKVPEGSRAYAGIGCHYMAQWMDRETLGFTHMGAEGANWFGEAPFSKTPHVFQNIGDGTYNHSGVQAIRAAVMSGVNMTYKVLFNDAVAMTGGQGNEGGLDAYQIARELLAMGVSRVYAVHDEKEELDLSLFPKEVEIHERAELDEVQKACTEIEGVSAIIYVQTCAAEKRRRRKRGTFPDPDKRVFINTDVCEGCGDCGVQSNCVSIVPQETELGRKRAIDQSSCNKDFSCLKGFCPSFVTLEGAEIRKERPETKAIDLPDMPEPAIAPIEGTHNMIITGVGGTGVVTIGAVLAQAAQIDGKGAGMMEMAGLAQKGGAVHIHLRLAETPGDITAIRVANGEADAVIGGDLVVTAGGKTLGLTRPGRAGAVVNSHEIITGDFTRDTEFSLPADRLVLQLEARLGRGLRLFDASALARVTMGDSIFSNMLLLGAAWQLGLVPISRSAIKEAVGLNGQAVEANLRAFEIGRWTALHPDQAEALLDPVRAPAEKTLAEKIDFRADHLRAYQGRRLAKRYRKAVERFEDPALREAVAKSYHKLLAYKDEYEVARLLKSTRRKAKETFAGDFRISYHLAPPTLGTEGKEGRPPKRRFGPWFLLPLGLLSHGKILRGTRLDPFGRAAERRMERALITQYEGDMERLLEGFPEDRRAVALALAALPLEIRGFGPVKIANEAEAAKRREALLAELDGLPEDRVPKAAE